MGKIIDLNSKFNEWYNTPIGYSLLAELAYEDAANPVKLMEWLKLAYMQGAKDMATEDVDALYDFGTAIAGTNEIIKLEDGFDQAADNLKSYHQQLFKNE